MLGKNKTGLEKLRQRAERSIEHGWDRPRGRSIILLNAKQWEIKYTL